MSTELPAEGFLRHRGLILAAVGGAAAESGLLTLVAPAARSVLLSGHPVTDAGDAQLRSEAELITSVATAWRMPITTSACPG
jgi:hypothetical protein